VQQGTAQRNMSIRAVVIPVLLTQLFSRDMGRDMGRDLGNFRGLIFVEMPNAR